MTEIYSNTIPKTQNRILYDESHQSEMRKNRRIRRLQCAFLCVCLLLSASLYGYYISSTYGGFSPNIVPIEYLFFLMISFVFFIICFGAFFSVSDLKVDMNGIFFSSSLIKTDSKKIKYFAKFSDIEAIYSNPSWSFIVIIFKKNRKLRNHINISKKEIYDINKFFKVIEDKVKIIKEDYKRKSRK